METGKQATIAQANRNGYSSKWALTSKRATNRTWAYKLAGKQARGMRVNQTRELLEMRMRQEYEQAVTVLIDEKTSNQKKIAQAWPIKT